MMEPRSPRAEVNAAVRSRKAAMRAWGSGGLVALLVLGGCAHPGALDDREQAVRAVLALLAQGNRPVCVDAQTTAAALTIFREAEKASRASRAQRHWYPPLPLRPDVRRTPANAQAAVLDGGGSPLDQVMPLAPPLPPLREFALDGAATRLFALPGASRSGVVMRAAWAPAPVVKPRWWPLNRIDRGCWPLFSISNPVVDRRTAFVGVRAEHVGTLYALEKVGAHWAVVAEWSRWLY